MAVQPKAKPKAGWFDMPSASKKQHNLMAMVAHDPAAAKRIGIPQSVGAEFMKADKGKKFGTGGRSDRQTINQPKTSHGKSALFKEGGHIMATKKMSMGGGAMMKSGLTTAKMGKVTAGGKRPHGEHTAQQKGHTKAMMPKMAGNPIGGGMKKGGMAKKK
jgi:hypothetical protein